MAVILKLPKESMMTMINYDIIVDNAKKVYECMSLVDRKGLTIAVNNNCSYVDFFKSIHDEFGLFPDDDLYMEIYLQLRNLSECNNPDDIPYLMESDFITPEHNTYKLCMWVATHMDYADNQINNTSTMFDCLQEAYSQWRKDVLGAVIDNLEDL